MPPSVNALDSLDERRANRRATADAARLARPHNAMVECDQKGCTEFMVVRDAERLDDVGLALAFHRAGWDLTRTCLCPIHAPRVIANRSRARRQRGAR